MSLSLPKAGLVPLALVAALQLAACTPRQLIVDSLADELSAAGQGNENDLDLLRDAAPFHLKLSESVLRQNPGHRALAESVAAGFTAARNPAVRTAARYVASAIADGVAN